MLVTWDQLAGPIGFSIYIPALAASAFALGVRGLPWWYQLLVGVAAASAVTCLWLTCLVDPGSIPAAEFPDPLIEQLDEGLPVPQSHLYTRDSRGTWMRRADQGACGEAWFKWCTTCNVWRPPRAHHCSTCDACFSRWDHHCAVVGNCVAARNHRFFTAFLVSAQLGCLLGLGGAVWRLHLRGLPKPGVWIGTESFFILLLAVVYGYHAVVLLFGSLHCLSIVLDVTTKDVLTQGKQLRHNPPCCPGSRSPARLVRSWRELCCLPFAFRGWQRAGGTQPVRHAWRQVPDREDGAGTLGQQHGHEAGGGSSRLLQAGGGLAGRQGGSIGGGSSNGGGGGDSSGAHARAAPPGGSSAGLGVV